MSRGTALVIGANRGIGLNLVRRLVKHGWTVSGSIRPQSRKDASALDLEETGASIVEIDYLDEESIRVAAKGYGQAPLDLLVNCAGVGPGPDNWQDHTREILLEKFCVNAVGPFLTTKHFYPALKRSEAAKIINISGNAASTIRNNGKDIGYRMSKSALNQQTVTLAKEMQDQGDNIAVVAVYPGYVATRLSEFRSRNDMDECMDGTVNVIEQVGMSQTGTFLDWKGQTVPW